MKRMGYTSCYSPPSVHFDFSKNERCSDFHFDPSEHISTMHCPLCEAEERASDSKKKLIVMDLKAELMDMFGQSIKGYSTYSEKSFEDSKNTNTWELKEGRTNEVNELILRVSKSRQNMPEVGTRYNVDLANSKFEISKKEETNVDYKELLNLWLTKSLDKSKQIFDNEKCDLIKEDKFASQVQESIDSMNSLLESESFVKIFIDTTAYITEDTKLKISKQKNSMIERAKVINSKYYTVLALVNMCDTSENYFKILVARGIIDLNYTLVV